MIDLKQFSLTNSINSNTNKYSQKLNGVLCRNLTLN